MSLLERQAADAHGLSLYALMERAGEAVWLIASRRFPAAQHWLILCGPGNNGGDGYVIARLALMAGKQVTVLASEDQQALPEEAQQARQAWRAVGDVQSIDTAWPTTYDIVIDALLGNGLNRAPSVALAAVIEQVNQSPAPVVAVDVPSGLSAANGAIPGACIQAALTVSLIALRPGLLTGKARDVVGTLQVATLGLHAWLEKRTAPWQRIDAAQLINWLPARRATSHKGDHGKLLLVGGAAGTAGAIRLAGEAALRSGAGLVRVLTHSSNVAPMLTARPELMVDELGRDRLDQALAWADIVVVGPGLGQEKEAQQALEQIENTQKPMLWDADALNLLAFRPQKRQNRVITPHPGEAARLLNLKVSDIESDRLHAAQLLARRYGGVVVLKGAGTLIVSEAGEQAIADVGNAGMASGGMGDVLSGIIGSLMAQGLALFTAASAGCVVHGAAADQLARHHGMRGMLASDLFSEIRQLVNPGITLKE